MSAARKPAVFSGNPLIRAQIVLGSRVHSLRGGAVWRLDGRPAAVCEVVRAANAELGRQGQALIAYPGVALPTARRSGW